MLYERWRQTAHDFRNEIALHDLASGQRWTFSALATIADSASDPNSPILFPQGINASFIFTVLQGWRFQKLICPLDEGKPAPTLAKLPEKCVHLKSTSASTGPERMIQFRAEQLAADADNIMETMGLKKDAPNLAVISLAHSYGFSNLVLPLLLHGIPLVLAESALPETVRRAAAQFEKITLPAVPALWRTWLGAKSIPKNIALAISAGSLLPLALEKEIFEQFGLKIHNFYGASECGGIAFDARERPRTDPTLVGAPMKHVAARVNDQGCLQVCGTAVGETYWPEPEPTLIEGRFTTSDLAEVHDGQIFLVGRAGDQINVAGRKISPEFIETALLAHPEVADSLVFGIPSEDAERGESIVACVSVNGRISAETLKQFLLAKLPAWKVPREWWIVDSLQTNERGKRSRSEWRQNYLKLKSAGNLNA